jgi:hypothetical protein
MSERNTNSTIIDSSVNPRDAFPDRTIHNINPISSVGAACLDESISIRKYNKLNPFGIENW